ncbi:hypothetical protein [Parasegetibacter sp. NRK P23]|nr:hypothetical protein [Parasegetibacter sp. NRK P23]
MKKATGGAESPDRKFNMTRISVIVIAALVLEIIFFSLFTKYFS